MKSKKVLIRIFLCLLVTALGFSLSSCGETAQDTSPLTMYVGLGNRGNNYYNTLHEAILENTGIDVEFVFTNTGDTTNAVATRIKNYDLPADIVITAQKTDAEDQAGAFLDLAKLTNVTDLFKATTVRECDVNGSVYQLPFTTRLIGITYNKTLFEELGWELPSNYEEMVALKKKADAAGVKFAVTGGVATGHGFNYLFHILGTEFLSNVDGTQWLSEFKEGTVNADQFEEAAAYFEKFTKSGLFGSFHNQDWAASKEYCQTRALFYINLTNDCYSYSGPEYDENGEVIEGTELNDVYASMPWISEDGKTNCYAIYHSMYLALDKKLADEDQADKLANAVKVLEFLTTEEATKIFTDIFQDGYVTVNSFEIDESRLYYNYADSIEEGFTMPWYYQEFDVDTIVNVGDKVNKYIAGTDGITLSDIVDELEYQNQMTIEGKIDEYLEIKETFSYEESAKLQARANALSLDQQKVFVDVSILPYTDDVKKLPVEPACAVIQEKFYEGEFALSTISKVYNSKTQYSIVLTMTGAEIKEFVNNGFDISQDYENAKEGYTVFPYAMVTRSNMELNDNESYLVTVPKDAMASSVYAQFEAEGRVLLDDSGNAVQGNTQKGLIYLMDNYDSIGPDDNIW